jgi:DNA-binding NarL/FixJ family response regulator
VRKTGGRDDRLGDERPSHDHAAVGTPLTGDAADPEGHGASVRVLVVDDGELSRRGLRHTLERHGVEVVAEADGSERATQLARDLGPDLAVVHLDSLPQDRGAALLSALTASVRVLLLGKSMEPSRIVAWVETGACGYVARDLAGPALAASVLAAARGGVLLLPRDMEREVVRRVRGSVRDRAARPVSRPRLSERERQVLELMVGGKDNAAIGEELFISPSTVKKHVTRILRKLGVQNRVQAAVKASHRGAEG